MAIKKKCCLIFIGIFVAVILLMACSVYYNMATSRERNNKDDINCANTALVENNPLISINDSSILVNQKIEIFVINGKKNHRKSRNHK